MLNINSPTLSVSLARFTHIANDGSEADVGVGIRILLRYSRSSNEDLSFEIVDTQGFTDVLSMAPIEMMSHIQNRKAEIDDLIQFGEENLQGVTIGGDLFTWDKLAADGYEFQSPSKRTHSPPNR